MSGEFSGIPDLGAGHFLPSCGPEHRQTVCAQFWSICPTILLPGIFTEEALKEIKDFEDQLAAG